jgi:hypothetical protein
VKTAQQQQSAAILIIHMQPIANDMMSMMLRTTLSLNSIEAVLRISYIAGHGLRALQRICMLELAIAIDIDIVRVRVLARAWLSGCNLKQKN